MNHLVVFFEALRKLPMHEQRDYFQLFEDDPTALDEAAQRFYQKMEALKNRDERKMKEILNAEEQQHTEFIQQMQTTI